MNDTAPPFAEELTSAEQAILTSILAGRRADAKGELIGASLLRTLATEARPQWQLLPIGLALENVVIQGTLDLEGCSISKPLVFQNCKFRPIETSRGAILLRDARVKRLALYECSIAGAIKADRSHIESALFLTGSTLEGGIRLRGATIGEALAIDQATISNAGQTAVLADGLRLAGPWILRGANINGEVRFTGARLDGSLLWEEAKISNNTLAVIADGAKCEGDWVLRRAIINGPLRLRNMTVKSIDAQQITVAAGTEAFNARGAVISSDLVLDGATLKGGVLLGRAQITGEFSARGAKISGPMQDWALAANGLIAGQGIALMNAKLQGGLSLSGARVSQSILANSIEIDGRRGRAVEADVVHVGGNWLMRGAKISGSVRFAGAQIDGQVGFTEIAIDGGGDLAIRADGATIRGGWFMGRSKIRGLVRLPSARLGNEMRLRGTTIEVTDGPALFANGVTIARELVLDGGFNSRGGVVLDRAEIAGTFHLTGSRIQSAALSRRGQPAGHTHDAVLTGRYDEVAIGLADARLDRLAMPETAEDRPRGVVDLSRARVDSYQDSAAAWPPSLRGKSKPDARSIDGPDHLVLDGFVYDHLANPTGVGGADIANHQRGVSAAHMRLRWLEAQSSEDLALHFKPQAWMHLARRLSAQGYHDDAREIAIARRRRQRHSASTSYSARLQNWLLDVFALYGFNPWRTVTWMAVFVCLFAGIWWWAAQGCLQADCKDERVFVMALKGNYGQDDALAAQRYPGFTSLAYSFDVFIPFVNFGFKEHWRPRTSYLPLAEIRFPAAATQSAPALVITVGGVLYAFYVFEMLIGLVLTSLAVTAFTGLLKGDDESR